VADQTITSAPALLRRLLVDPVAVAPFPRVWLPSSSASKTALVPAPSVVLRTGAGNSAHVDATGVTCNVDVAAGNGQVVSGPIAGYKLPDAQTLLSANGTVLGQAAVDPFATPVPRE
jgi:hypothetical protein